ncbi:MAG TPA: metal-sensitive transcriptional regulator [Nitrososphaerales archaeon]|nr:metal-sensitive transcriptional regulator [Nitrososphaerales archaeon]
MASHRRDDVARRVARIHGHVHAINEMLDEGRSYSEVAHQIIAVRSALDSVVQVIVEDLVEDCFSDSEKREDLTESLAELKKVVATIR